MSAAIPELIRKAREQLHELTGLELASTVSARKDEGRWCVRVEVVEKRSIPDSQDILAIYEVTVDDDGNVADFTRIGMRRRNDVLEFAGAEHEA